MLLASAPQNLPPGLSGAFILLGLGMGVVFAVLAGLTFIIWAIGRVARDRTAEEGAPLMPSIADGAAATPPAGGGLASAAAVVGDGGLVRRDAGGELSSAESVAVAVAVACEAGAGTSAEVAAIAAAVRLDREGRAGDFPARRVSVDSECGAGSWGAAAFGGRGGAGGAVLRRG